MSQETPRAFFSYSREDTAFVMQLAKDLRAAGANVWLDQLDIHVGDRWDASVEEALHKCPRVILVVSPGSVASNNVMDEVSFAIDEQKTVIPVLYRDCKIPFRLRRLQYLDARSDYQGAVRGLLRLLGVEQGHATSQPMLMLDEGMFDKGPVEEAKEKGSGKGGAATAQAVAPAVAPPRREPEQRAPAAPPAAAAKVAPAGRGQTKNLAIGGGAALALGAVIWLVASVTSHHDSQPAAQAQAAPSTQVSAASQTAAAVPASTPDSAPSASAPAASPAAGAPARPVAAGSAPVSHVAKTAAPATESHPVVSQPAPPSPTPVESAPPPATKASAAAPSISLPAVFTFKTRSKLHSYTPLRVLGSGSDRLTLNTDGSFALKQGKQTLNGNFTLSGTRLVLNAPNRTWTNTIDGNTMVDEDGSTWVRQK
jgi:hypothetical protein